MNFNFAPETQYSQPTGTLIPANTLAFARLTIRGLKTSNNTGGRYADLELIIDSGPFESRRVWPLIMDPSDAKNSEGARNMGMGAIQHICEAAGLFDPTNPQTYTRFSNGSFEDVLKAIDGKRVAIKVGIEKGKDGHQDKNRVLAWLTPNPASADNKGWKELNGAAPAGGAVSGGFGGFGQSQPSQPAGQPVDTFDPSNLGNGSAPSWLGG